MPTAISADGKRHMFPEGTERGIIDRVMKDYASPGSSLPAEPGFATSSALASPRAQAERETITGTSDQSQHQLYTSLEQVSQQLRAAGKTDQEIESDPKWQEAAKNLSRAVSAGETGTAAMGAGDMVLGGVGAAAAGKIGQGVDALKAAMPGAKEAVAREGGEALRGEATTLAQDQVSGATARAVARPVDTSAQQAAARDAGGRVGAARTAASEANARVAAAEERNRISGTRLAGVDKYAAGEKSTSAIRSARKEFEDSNRELIQAKAARDQAATGRATVEREGAAAQRDLRGAQSEASKAAKGAEGAQKIADKYSTLRNQIATEPDAKKIATQADSLFNDLRRNGLISDAKHNELIQQVDKVRSQVRDAEVARHRLQKIIRYGLTYGTVGFVGYEGSHILRGMIP